MCHHTEQHQEYGHRHHDHVVANAAKDREQLLYLCITEVKSENGGVFM